MKKPSILFLAFALFGFTYITAFAASAVDDTWASDVPQAKILSYTDLQRIGCATSSDGQINQHEGCVAAAEADLTMPFHTAKKIIFVATQNSDGSGPLNLCFVQNNLSDCHYPQTNYWDLNRLGISLNEIRHASILYPRGDSRYPILSINIDFQPGSASACRPNVTTLWGYDPASGKFKQLLNWSDDCLEDMRFETAGPLAGDMVVTVDNPTKHFPWPWGIQVYKFIPPDRYIKILDFIGKANQVPNYNWANGVIDFDTPEILHRLRLSN